MARNSEGHKVMTEKGKEVWILYAAAAFFLFVWSGAMFGFLGFIGEAGSKAGIGWKVLSVVFLIGAGAILVRANNTGEARIGTYLAVFALLVLAILSAMGFDI